MYDIFEREAQFEFEHYDCRIDLSESIVKIFMKM